jgi:hypothetical protein
VCSIYIPCIFTTIGTIKQKQDAQKSFLKINLHKISQQLLTIAAKQV